MRSYCVRVYARTSLGYKDVRPKGAWTYVHRFFSRKPCHDVVDNNIKARQNADFPFPDCIEKGEFSE